MLVRRCCLARRRVGENPFAALPELHLACRYGRNRQRTDFNLVDPASTRLGHKQVQRWNLPEGWVISRHPAHPALISEADFIAVQEASAPAARPVRPPGGICSPGQGGDPVYLETAGHGDLACH